MAWVTPLSRPRIDRREHSSPSSREWPERETLAARERLRTTRLSGSAIGLARTTRVAATPSMTLSGCESTLTFIG